MDETKPCMEILKKILKLVLMFVVLGVMWIAGNLLFGTITDFKPEKEIKLAVRGKAVAQPDSIFSFINWNIGYGGLGEKADFFYDGGKMVVSAEEDVDNYLAGIYNFAKSNDSVDFFFFQEGNRFFAVTYCFSKRSCFSLKRFFSLCMFFQFTM